MRSLRDAIVATLVLVTSLALSDAAFVYAFPTAPRLSANFSPAYVELEVARLRAQPRAVVFLGDSALWGYGLPARDTVPSIVRQDGRAVANFTYEGGSAINTYAMLHVLLAAGVRPSCVVFNVNQKTFNESDNAYARIHPSIWALARKHMSAADIARTGEPPGSQSLDAVLDRSVSNVWRVYAMRTDLREALFGNVDAAHAADDVIENLDGTAERKRRLHVPTPGTFEGTYDLTPLGSHNVSVHFLRETIALLRAAHVPAVAVLTPTNHRLLHDFIDVPAYASNVRYVARILQDGGVRVLDEDSTFDARDFIDNDHLHAAASARLAHTIEAALGKR